MKQRIQKLIADSGLASRRKAEALIAAGRVSVNGRPAELGASADPDQDVIEVDGERLSRPPEKVCLMLHKPRGVITTMSDEKNSPTAAQLVADCPVRVYPVGRLDCDSEGLLLFTNDGALANRLMHPSGAIRKVYLVWVSGFYDGAEEKLRRRVEIDGYRIQTPEVRLRKRNGEEALLEVTICEGRNRQIRKMCALAGLAVTRLRRIREGSLALGKLPAGSWRYLTEAELRYLQSL